MKLIWIQMKLARAQVGIFILVALLQRTPVVKCVLQFERALSAPVAKIVKMTTWVATSMGLFHATAGATTYQINPASPADATVGEEFSLVFDITGTPAEASSWRVTGDIPPGLSIPGLVGNNINTEDSVAIVGTPTTAGTYNVIAQPWNGLNQTAQTTTATTITIVVAEPPPPAPEIRRPPVSTRVPTGGRAQFFFEPEGVVDSIQWFKDGVEVAGATSETLVIQGASAADEGAYSVEVTNVTGSAVSASGSLTIDDAATAELVNLANRGFVGTGGDIMIPGMVILGDSKTVLVRGLGPALEAQGVPGFLEDPELKVYQTIFENGLPVGSQLLFTNDDWEVGPNSDELAVVLADRNLPLTPGSKDAAIFITLGQGVFTFQLSGVGQTTGVGLVELFVVE